MLLVGFIIRLYHDARSPERICHDARSPECQIGILNSPLHSRNKKCTVAGLVGNKPDGWQVTLGFAEDYN